MLQRLTYKLTGKQRSHPGVSLCFFLILLIPAFSQGQTKLTVAKDGTGNFVTVQQAFDAVPVNNKIPVTIYVKNGVYREKVHLDSTKDYVALIGEEKSQTIISYDDHPGKVDVNGDSINTRSSWTCKIKGDYFYAENITFQNDAGFTAGQAVAMESDGDKAVFTNCRFVGNQDVLFTNADNSRQYFSSCYIEGTTDFIFGSATVWFEKCVIHSKKNSHVTAASTPQDHKFGYVFNHCWLTGDTSLHKVSLGRPWRPYANVIFMNCFIGEHVMAEGWANWNKTENFKTARYSEYRNYGPGANVGGRVNWSRQLTDEEAKHVNPDEVLGNWIHEKLIISN